MPNYYDPNLLGQLIDMAFKQAGQKYSSGFTLAQPKGGFSLANTEQQSPLAQVFTEGKKNTNINDRIKAIALALSSLALLKPQGERMAPAATMGQKYPVKPEISFPKRPLGFNPILGGRR